MYVIKEAVIAKEHIGKGFEPSIFYMDMRTYGKDFEKYYDRAKTEGSGLSFQGFTPSRKLTKTAPSE
jgi:heterodisulfide reductase subunit A-like polyferredoxin